MRYGFNDSESVPIIRVKGRPNMPKYVIEREILGAGNLSDTELKEISRESVTVLKKMGPEI